MISHVSSYTITMRIEGRRELGLVHKILGMIAAADGLIGAIDLVEPGEKRWVRDFTVHCSDPDHEKRITKVVKEIEGIKIIAVSDETFRMHLGGKLQLPLQLGLSYFQRTFGLRQLPSQPLQVLVRCRRQFHCLASQFDSRVNTASPSQS